MSEWETGVNTPTLASLERWAQRLGAKVVLTIDTEKENTIAAPLHIHITGSIDDTRAAGYAAGLQVGYQEGRRG